LEDVLPVQLLEDVLSSSWNFSQISFHCFSDNRRSCLGKCELPLAKLPMGFTLTLFCAIVPVNPKLTVVSGLESSLLNGNLLTGPIPSEIAQLTNLNRLQLDQNQLSGPLPPTLGNLTQVRHL
jgi:hypothetical protein